MPDVSRTRHTFRSAEFGFFGVTVYTRVHTPLRWGEPARPRVFVFFGRITSYNVCYTKLLRRTRQTFRRAEFGFLGVVV